MNFTKFTQIVISKFTILGNFFIKKSNQLEVMAKEDKVSFHKLPEHKLIRTNVELQPTDYLTNKQTNSPIIEKLKFLKKSNVLDRDFINNLSDCNDRETIKEIFYHQEKLKDIIPDDIIATIVDKYKDSIFKSSCSIEVAFDFLEKYQSNLSIESTIKLIKISTEYYTVTNDFEQEAIKLVKEKYSQEIRLIIPKKQDIININNKKNNG